MVQGDDFKFMSCLLLLAQGSIKIYKLPLPKDLDDHTIMGFDPQFGFFQVRIYFQNTVHDVKAIRNDV